MSKFSINRHLAALPSEDQTTLRMLERLGQEHLVEHWPEPGCRTSDKQRLLAQVRLLDSGYPGGLERYLKNAAELLEKSRHGETPYEGYIANVPEGFRVDLGSSDFLELEAAGLLEANRCAFTLVAGGLGERLGFPGIKLALSVETATNRSFLEVYIQHVLALQRCSAQRSGEARQLPMAIMTSDDTYAETKRLLAENSYFGMEPGQVTILKQEQVAGIANSTPHLALNPSDPYQLLTKPHGHGDVHALLHQTGLARHWFDLGIRWLLFFQDTNALTFKGLLAALAISAKQRLDVNSLTVPRQPGEAAGGLVRLVKPGTELTVNVEYNQLDALLLALPGGKGDVPDHTGYSPYPGNTNVFVLGLESYVRTLERTGGIVPEFVNPKYTDATRTSFRSATRLECMMQDYPRLAQGAHVGFTQFERSVCFSPVKNGLEVAAARQAQDPPLPVESASSGEADLYAFHRRVLRLAGAEVEDGPVARFRGIGVVLFPIILVSPELTTPLAPFLKKLTGVHISRRSTLVIDAGTIEIHGLELDGALEIRAVRGAHIVIRDIVVKNRGWVARELDSASEVPPVIAIRGFCFDRHETLVIEATRPGEYIVDSAKLQDRATDPGLPGRYVVAL